MAERPVRIITKRTAVPGKIPTGTTGTELNLIKTGELASNLADKKLFSYDGSNVFEFGSNSFLGLTGGTISGDLNVTGTISASTYYNLPSLTGNYLPISGGTVTGATIFQSGVTANTIYTEYIDFNINPTVPSPTGGTLYFDSTENALSYKPITNQNDVTVNIGQESLIRIFNNTGTQINNGQVLHITGATSGSPTVSLAVGTGGNEVQFQISGIATHDIPNLSYGFMTAFGVVRDVNLTAFTIGEQVYLSQTTPGGFARYSDLSFTGRTCEVGHVIDNSALGKVQVTILNEIEGTIITTQENNILAANNSSTGVFQFSGLTIDTPSGTTFSIGAAEGWIIDNVTAPTNPTIQLILYPGSTGNASLYYSSATETYILLTSASTIVQQTTFPTPQQRRQNLYLGKFGHGTRQFLINAFNEPDSALSPVSQLRDMFTAVKLINDGVIASANGANLNINTSAGALYGLGIGYVTNKLNPNSLTINSQSPATFQYRTQTGGTAASTTLIDPLNYDVNGFVTPLVGTKATNQRIYLLQNGQIRIQYGQTAYNQLAAAVAALQNETFVTFPNFRDNGILIGILSVLSTCTDLTDTSKAQFFSVSKFGELIGAAGGTSTTTLQQAYNNSSNPEITTNSTLGGVQFRGGTGNNSDANIIIENNAGTVTGQWLANGGLSATTISATTVTASSNVSIGYSGATSDLLNVFSTSGVKSLTVLSNGSIYNPNSNTTNSNTNFGYNANIVNLTGTQSSSFGYEALANNDASNNTAVGYRALYQNTTGDANTAIGLSALRANTIGQNNTAIGVNSLNVNTTGSSNTAIGVNTLRFKVTGDDNVAIGFAALTSNVTGSTNTAVGVGSQQSSLVVDNTSLGYRSLYLNTVGLQNTAIGTSAVRSNTTGSYNTGVGNGSLQLNTTANYNTAIGYNSMYSNTTGTTNVALGAFSLYSNVGNNNNTAIGTNALRLSNGGYDNTALGFQSLYSNTIGYSNTALGKDTLFSNTSGFTNIAIGDRTLFSNTSGSYNVGIGYRSLYDNTTGLYNVSNGFEALRFNTIGGANIALGYKSMQLNTIGSNNVAVGYETLLSSTGVSATVAVGHRALRSLTTGANNTALGFEALFTNVSGASNTAVGYQSLYFNTGTGNSALGKFASYNNTTGTNNTAIGFEASFTNTTGSTNTAVGYQSLFNNTVGGNSALGRYASYSNTIGTLNTAIGLEALFTNTIGNNNTALGYRANFSLLSGSSNVALGFASAYNNVNGSNNVAIGYEALYVATGISSTVAVGYRALKANTIGTNNTSIGFETLTTNTAGSNNVALGHSALKANVDGNANTGIGYQALLANTTGINNVGLGYRALYQNTTASNNIGIGFGAGVDVTTGTYNTLIGVNAGIGLTTGNYNTIIGGVGSPSGLTSSLILADGLGAIKLSADSANHLFIPNSPSSGSTSDRILTRSSSGEVKEVDTTTVVLKTKSGVVAYTSFTGSPYSYDVVFTSAFSDALYSPQIIGYDARSWSISDVSASGFRIETNSTTLLTNNVYWTATKHGEN